MVYQGGCDAVVVSDDLVGILYSAKGDTPRPALLMLHGIPGSEKNVDLAYELRALGWHVLILSFRGTWGSKGDYDILSQPAQVSTALDFLLAAGRPWQVDPSALAVLGYSLGSRAALMAAHQDPRIKAVISVSGIADFEELMLDESFYQTVRPFLNGATAESLRRQWLHISKAPSPITLVSEITQPRLILHGTADEVIPLFMGEALAQAARLPLVRVEGADHTFTHQRGEFVAAITNWLSAWVAAR